MSKRIIIISISIVVATVAAIGLMNKSPKTGCYRMALLPFHAWGFGSSQNVISAQVAGHKSYEEVYGRTTRCGFFKIGSYSKKEDYDRPF